MEPQPRSMQGVRKPLQGVRVLVTRPRGQAQSLVAGLEALGARVLAVPLIEVEPQDATALRAAAADAGAYDWVAFTSANAVAALWDAAEPAAQQLLAQVRAACVGPATAGALRERGVEAAVVAGTHTAEGLLEALRAVGVAGTRVLLPQAADARPVLAEGLRAAGAEVTVIAAYRTRDAPDADAIRAPLQTGEIDLVTFTASSAVRSFLRILGTETGGARIAVIGPVTANTAREHGLPVDIVAQEHTVDGLLAAITEVFARRSE